MINQEKKKKKGRDKKLFNELILKTINKQEYFNKESTNKSNDFFSSLIITGIFLYKLIK